MFLSAASAEALGRIRPGWVLLSGLAYLILGMLVHRRSAPALVVAVAVYAGDGVRSAFAATLVGEDVPLAGAIVPLTGAIVPLAGAIVPAVGLLVRGVLIAGMIRGIRATRLLPPRDPRASPGMEAISGESLEK